MVRSRTSWSDSSVVFTRTDAIYPRVLPILESMSPELTLAKICPKALCRSPPVFGGTRNNGSDSDVFRASPLRRPNSAARPAWECIEQKPSADAIALHACPSFVFALHLVPFTTSPEGSEKVSFPGLLANRILSLRLLSVELSRPTIPDCHGLLRPPCSETKWATSPLARRFPSPLRASLRKEHSGRYAHFGLPIGH